MPANQDAVRVVAVGDTNHFAAAVAVDTPAVVVADRAGAGRARAGGAARSANALAPAVPAQKAADAQTRGLYVPVAARRCFGSRRGKCR